MPMVPLSYSPVQGATPTVSSVGQQQIQASPADFGSQVGQARQGAGQGLDQTGNMLARHALAFQQIQNETDVNSVYANTFSPAFRDQYRKFYALQGKDAVDAYPTFMDSMEQLRQATRDSLANPVQQKLFDTISRRRVEMELDGMARHASQQNKVYRAQASEAIIESHIDMGVDKYSDPKALGMARNSILAEVEAYGAQAGQSAEVVRQRGQAALDKMYGGAVSFQALTDPVAAADMLGREAEAGNISGQAQERLAQRLKPLCDQQTSRKIVDAVMQGMGTQPPTSIDVMAHYQDWARQVRDAAEAVRPGDAQFRDTAISHLQQQVGTIQHGQQLADLGNRNLLARAIVGPNGPDGPNGVSSMEQLLADPQRAAAYSSLFVSNPDAVKFIQDMLTAKGAGKLVAPTRENQALWYSLYGQATNDPDGFSSVDLNRYYGLLPIGQWHQLVKVQGAINRRDGAEEEEQVDVNRLLSGSSRQLAEAGYNGDPGTDRDKKTWDILTGLVREALSRFRDGNGGRRPGPEDARKILGLVLSQDMDPTSAGPQSSQGSQGSAGPPDPPGSPD